MIGYDALLMLTATLLLDARSGAAEVRAAVVSALGVVNAARGLTFDDDGTETLDDVVYSVWTDDLDGPTATSWLRLVDDAPARSRYLELHAVDDHTLAALREALAERVHVLSHAEIDAAVRADPCLVRWLGHGGIDRPYDAGVEALLAEALYSADTELVAGAQVAIFLLRWRALVPLVQRTLAGATDPGQRAALAAILTASADW